MLNNLFARLMASLTEVKEREGGQTLVEYALILALVSVLLVGALTALQIGIGGVFSDVVGAL